MQRITESETLIRSRYNLPIDVAVVLGSGLGDFADELHNRVVIPYNEIPHFHQSSVAGHAGNLVLGSLGGLHLACMQGRFHFYEGHSMQEVTYPIRVFKKLGARFLLVTNAAGGINTSFKPGTLMLINDHLNLMGDNPLVGKNWDEFGPRFPDMSEAYSKKLRDLAKEASKSTTVELAEGVYAGLRGPTYETPAEIRMLRTLGADAVGMSTVPEVIVANHMSMDVLGISCITNMAAGTTDQKLDHAEVMETADRVRTQCIGLLSEIVNRLALQEQKAHV